MDKIERIKELVELLNRYRHEYYNLNKPSISDLEYDKLFDTLKSLEDETNFILYNSPTQTVGYEVVSKLQKVTHKTPLKSLDKTKSIEELNKWRKNQNIGLMLKADGLTVELDYENGILVEASTRGNGEIGEIITHNARTFMNIPKKIIFEGRLRISGEAIIHTNDFDEINSKLSEDDKYKTPRNLVAGSVRQLDSEICASRNVYFYAFNILEATDTEYNMNTLSDSKWENFRWLREIGFEVIPKFTLGKDDDIEISIEELKQIAIIKHIPIDGLVATYDSIEYSNRQGETSHHPLHSIAYKFEDETEESVLRSVEWNTTRTGQINPTACFDTVLLDNTEVSRASLFNLTFIEDMKLNIGSRIKVSKRNLIIPYIEHNLDKDLGILEFPEVCPSCGVQTTIKNTGTADFLMCENDNCPSKLVDKFVHFVKRDCMNIEGFSSASIELFLNKGFLKSFDSIYNLEQYKDKIIKLEGWGEKSFVNLQASIEKSRKVKCENFIYALGIPNIGKSSSKTIAKYFNNDFQAFMRACKDKFDFSRLEDFGSISSKSIHDWYSNTNEVLMRMYLIDEIEIEQETKTISSEGVFKGMKIYCTGTFASHKKEELKAIVENNGGEFASGYSKSLNYLVVGSVKGSSKTDKALKDGVKVLQENEFLDMIS